MATPEIAHDAVCVNPKCDEYGVEGRENVTVRSRYGVDSIRFFRCRRCRAEFSERHGTPLFGLRILHEEIVSVVNHLAEGTGVQKTARLTGVSRETVGRILKRTGNHAGRSMTGWYATWIFLKSRWTRCGLSWEKKDKNCTEEERSTGEAGSIWDHVATNPVSKLVVSMVQGPQRDQGTCDRLVSNLTLPTGPEVSHQSWSPLMNMPHTKPPCWKSMASHIGHGAKVVDEVRRKN